MIYWILKIQECILIVKMYYTITGRWEGNEMKREGGGREKKLFSTAKFLILLVKEIKVRKSPFLITKINWSKQESLWILKLLARFS